jgi:hypothetical protein
MVPLPKLVRTSKSLKRANGRSGGPTLPIEVQFSFLEFITDRQTQFTLSLVSHALNAEAERYLYRHNHSLSSWDSKLHFLHSILSNPSRGKHVTNFTWNFFYIPVQGKALSRFIATLTQCLHLFTNLRRLEFFRSNPWSSPRDPSPSPSFPSIDILDSCVFQLEEFWWQCNGDEEELLSFLRQQRSLRRLYLHEWGSKFSGTLWTLDAIMTSTSTPAQSSNLTAKSGLRERSGLEGLPNIETLDHVTITLEGAVTLLPNNQIKSLHLVGPTKRHTDGNLPLSIFESLCSLTISCPIRLKPLLHLLKGIKTLSLTSPSLVRSSPLFRLVSLRPHTYMRRIDRRLGRNPNPILPLISRIYTIQSSVHFHHNRGRFSQTLRRDAHVEDHRRRLTDKGLLHALVQGSRRFG